VIQTHKCSPSVECFGFVDEGVEEEEPQIVKDL